MYLGVSRLNLWLIQPRYHHRNDYFKSQLFW